ncbi:hypothetical protein THMIRHAM_06180 [Thiomicrorhabdus immobilis]|uniref:Class I SAM-dependent methyltransferase n=1 Tax=Thiomicrorhabdus immobilis TaxID=2791037 RepID=A0ABM7MBT0_9GAMM|nr:hypothetical protein THMIRHAM_06180 [Thiomicrorhabdus immobilis]
MQRLPKIVLALLIQLGVLLVVTVGVYLAPAVISPPYPYWGLVFIQALLASLVSCRLGLPCWWRWIQFFIPVGLYLGVLLKFDPIWALVIFVVVWMVFANAFKERVPLYLTNNTTREALKNLVKRKRRVRFLDLGCGLGGNVAFMSQLKPVAESHGVETAPIPYLISKMITALRGGQTFAMDMWKTELAYYDVVYAFLSPEPMPRLWNKVKEEMLPGSIFVSNSFAVPDVEPSEVWELSDSRKTILYIYRL